MALGRAVIYFSPQVGRTGDCFTLIFQKHPCSKRSSLSWVHSRVVDALVKGNVSGVLELSLSVFDQKGTTESVNTGPSPVRGPLVVATDFTEQ